MDMELVTKKRNLLFWTGALLSSLFLNLFLLDLMAYMIQKKDMNIEFSQFVQSIDVVRVKRKEQVFKKKEIRPKEEPKKRPKTILRQVKK